MIEKLNVSDEIFVTFQQSDCKYFIISMLGVLQNMLQCYDNLLFFLFLKC